MSRSEEEVAFDSWTIVYSAGRVFIGRMQPDEQKTSLMLRPAYELVDLKAPVSIDGQNYQMLAMCEVQPIAGCLFDVTIHVELQAYTCIMLDELADGDRNMLKDKIGKLRGRLVELRAARSGIKLVT